jgi:hypothetical protein
MLFPRVLFPRPVCLASFLVVLASLLAPAATLAGLGPENVCVVINGDSWASLAIANEFIRLRQIPPGNVVVLSNLPDLEKIDVDACREKILLPVLKTLEARGLGGQIDCIAYSADIPYSVNVSSDLKQIPKLPQVLTPEAALNGLTYLYRYTLSKNPTYLRLDVNRYYRRPVTSAQDRPLTDGEGKLLAEAAQLARDEKWDGCAAKVGELLTTAPHLPAGHFLLARAQAALGKFDEALKALGEAVAQGWMDTAVLEADPRLAELRQRPEFAKLIAAIKGRTIDVQPSLAFKASLAFDPAGKPLPPAGPPGPSELDRYLLSTVLAATCGRGNSVREAIAGLRRSAAADGSLPAGTIYFVKNGDVRSTTRQAMFPHAVAKLKQLGVAAEIVDGSVPVNKANVQGAMLGIADFNWAGSHSVIQPGAICEHLTSFGGVLTAGAGQTPLTELIRHGAAGASGTVTEPYAIQAKFPFPFIHVHYAQGCTLAEAFYQSLAGPYQLLIVGDPLCRPWAKIPRVEFKGLEAGKLLTGKITLRPEAVTAKGDEVDHFELFVGGIRRGLIRPGQTVDLDTTTFPDGFHELRAVAVLTGPIQTQGRAVQTIEIKNHGQTLAVQAPKQVKLDEKLKLTLELANAKRMSIWQHGRELAVVDAAKGSVEIDARRLGLGPVTLSAVGELEGEGAKRVLSQPIEVEVLPPAPLAAQPAPEKLEPGMWLTADGLAKGITATSEEKWLEKAGIAADQPYRVRGYLEVGEADVYQLLVRTQQDYTLTVDGAAQAAAPGGSGWRQHPVHLAAGLHLVEIQGRGPAPFQIRFGGPGATNIDGRFKHAGK